jgi:hypothetical protein
LNRDFTIQLMRETSQDRPSLAESSEYPRLSAYRPETDLLRDDAG